MISAPSGEAWATYFRHVIDGAPLAEASGVASTALRRVRRCEDARDDLGLAMIAETLAAQHRRGVEISDVLASLGTDRRRVELGAEMLRVYRAACVIVGDEPRAAVMVDRGILRAVDTLPREDVLGMVSEGHLAASGGGPRAVVLHPTRPLDGSAVHWCGWGDTARVRCIAQLPSVDLRRIALGIARAACVPAGLGPSLASVVQALLIDCDGLVAAEKRLGLRPRTALPMLVASCEQVAVSEASSSA